MMEQEGARFVNKMPANEKLNHVLRIFATDMYSFQGMKLTGISIMYVIKLLEDENVNVGKFQDAFGDTTILHVTGIVEKLIEDGHVKSSSSGSFVITFNGDTFHTDGGYINLEKTDASKKRIQNLKDWLLIVGSLGAMTGALALAASEGIKLYAEHNKYFCLYADTTGGLLVLVLATILLYRK